MKWKVKYQGIISEGKPNGEGILFNEKGEKVWTGEFKNGKKWKGKGLHFLKKDQLKEKFIFYDGQLENGKANGRDGKSFFLSLSHFYCNNEEEETIWEG